MTNNINQEYLKEKDEFYKTYLEESNKLQKLISEFDKKFGLTKEDEEKNEDEDIKISGLRLEINRHKEKRIEIIKKVLGCLYNGVLIENELSFRQEGIYLYKHKYLLGLSRIVEIIERHINQVKDKLDEEKFGVLQFLIKEALKYPEHEHMNETMNETIEILFNDEIELIDIDENYDNEKSVILKKVGKIKINRNGQITFEYDDDNNWRTINLKGKLKNILIDEKIGEIEKAISGRMEKLNKYFDEIKTNIDNIKTKCAKYLILQDLRED